MATVEGVEALAKALPPMESGEKCIKMGDCRNNCLGFHSQSTFGMHRCCKGVMTCVCSKLCGTLDVFTVVVCTDMV